MDVWSPAQYRRFAAERRQPFDALVAIQMAHRLGAVALVVALGVAIAALWQGPRRFAVALLLLGLAQLLSGLSNVVLGWPIVAALAHSAGAAALVGVTTALIARTSRASVPLPRGAVASGSPA